MTTFWRESESGPPRHYYELTDAGREALDDFAKEWARFRDSSRCDPGQGGRMTTVQADRLVDVT